MHIESFVCIQRGHLYYASQLDAQRTTERMFWIRVFGSQMRRMKHVVCVGVVSTLIELNYLKKYRSQRFLFG